MIAGCITTAAGMFIVGYILGFISIAIFSGRSYQKGHDDGYREAQQNETLH